MAALVCSALGTDKESLTGKLISIEEHHGSDGNFVLNCLIADQVQKDGGVCLLALHNTFGHYHNVGTKLGYNLQQLQDKGFVETIEILKLLNESMNSNSESNNRWLLLGKEDLIVKNIFLMIKEKIDKLLQVRKLTSLVIDDLSDLLCLGIPLKEILLFFQYCRTLLESEHGVSLIVLTHIADGDEEQRLLSASVAHVADIVVTICGLKTGRSNDVSGALKVHHKGWNDAVTVQEWNKQNFYHFKLLDRQVKTFAPGTAPSLT
ncbi:elongator complex protein 6 [Periplaneta americana]|uniref:elongator complex protein 6 n=1 Tax=Periplaneta americana TaxID=6978 RepID=UPI0037E7D621